MKKDVKRKERETTINGDDRVRKEDAKNIFLTAAETLEESDTQHGNSVSVLHQSPAKTGGRVMRDNK